MFEEKLGHIVRKCLKVIRLLFPSSGEEYVQCTRSLSLYAHDL